MTCLDRNRGRRIGLVVTLGVAFVPCQSLADRNVVTGEIGTINNEERTLTLRTGEVFRAGPKVKLSSRRIGEKVIVVFEETEGDFKAIKVRRVPQALESFLPKAASATQPPLESRTEP